MASPRRKHATHDPAQIRGIRDALGGVMGEAILAFPYKSTTYVIKMAE
jgi:hypothetical protein